MSGIQRFFKAVMPRRWAEAMEAESRAWRVRCPCGFSRSVWALGGIRWKAAGKPRRRARCPRCERVTLHTITRDA